MFKVIGVTTNGEVQVTEHDTFEAAKLEMQNDVTLLTSHQLIGTGIYEIHTDQPARPVEDIFSSREEEARLYINKSRATVGLQ